MSQFRPVVDRAFCQERLTLIFPREAFDTVLSNALASTAVAAMIYVGAVEKPKATVDDQRFARPSTVLWMQDDLLVLDSDETREAWYSAAVGPTAEKAVQAYGESLGLSFAPWYNTNTRETLRDETFPKWREQGALVDRPGLPTTSSKPRWALAHEFADLFDPGLADDGLIEAIDKWADSHMSATGKLRAHGARQQARATHAVDVKMPDGGQRRLEPGRASLIIKGVVEEWAPRRLSSPLVLTISEPGDKVFLADQELMDLVGISIQVSTLLPDALLADVGPDPAEIWIIEAVATDGPISEQRRKKFIAWAETQGIDPAQCRFLTAFESRNSGVAKRRLKDIAAGTYAWFLDEPDMELSWSGLTDSVQHLAPVTQISPKKG